MSKLEKIQIGIPCGRNSESYVSFLVNSIEKTISDKTDYEFILGVNQQGVDLEFLRKIPNSIIVREIHDKDSSVGHGMCLDLIFRNMNTKYGVLVDSDVAFLAQDWDQKLLSELDDKTIMIGSEYHPTDGKIVDFPNVITCMFDVEVFKSLKVFFKPSTKTIFSNEKNHQYHGTKIGQKVYMDTGCHIPETIGPAGYSWKTLKIVSPRYSDRTSHMKFMKEGIRGEEYQLHGIPICTHIGRSLSRSFEKDPIVEKWKKRVGEWLDGKV